MTTTTPGVINPKWAGLDVTSIQDTKVRVKQVYDLDEARGNKRYLNFGCQQLNEATLGLEYGTFIIPAPPNLGKSTLMTNINHWLIENNDDVFILDLSLDDAFDIRWRQAIARMARIPINWVKYPNMDTVTDAARNARKFATGKWLRDIEPNLLTIDKTDFNKTSRNLTTIERIVYWAKETKAANKKMVVTVDGLHNIRADDYKGSANENQLQNWISDRLSILAEDAKCTFIASAHVSKAGGRRGANTFGDIKGSGNFGYDAHVIAPIYSDYKINRGNAEVWHDTELPHAPGNVVRLPVVELDIAKNKVSEYSNVIFFKHYPLYALMEEAPQDWQEHWREVVFGNNKKQAKQSDS